MKNKWLWAAVSVAAVAVTAAVVIKKCPKVDEWLNEVDDNNCSGGCKMGEFIKDKIREIKNKTDIDEKLESMLERVDDKADEIEGRLYDKLKEIRNKTDIDERLERTIDKVDDKADELEDKLSDKLKEVKNRGEDIGDRLKEKGERVMDRVEDAAEDIAKELKK